MPIRRGSPLVATLVAALLLASPGAVGVGWAGQARGTSPETGLPGGCELQRLAVPEGTESSRVRGGDPTGRHLVGTLYPLHGVETPVVWHDGVPEVLDIPLSFVELTGASSDGTVVGSGQTSGPDRAFVVLPDGTYQPLGSPASSNTFATGVSADGTVSGFLQTTGTLYTTVIWRPGAYDVPVELPVSTDFTTVSVGISANGWVAAATFLAEPERAFRWNPDLDRKRLRGTNPTDDVTVNSVAVRFAAGYQADPDTAERELLRWKLKSGRATAVDAPGQEIRAVNKRGVMATWAGQSWLVDGTDVLPLPPLVEDRGTSVETLSNAGIAAGYAAEPDGRLAAVRWVCG